MRVNIVLFLCLTAANAFAYEKTGFQAFIEIGYPKILLSKEKSSLPAVARPCRACSADASVMDAACRACEREKFLRPLRGEFLV